MSSPRHVNSSKEIAVIFGAHNYIIFVRFCTGLACFEQTESICLINILIGDFWSVMTSICHIFLLFITAKLLDCGTR